MKKKILFVIPSLDVGGGEKSLLNLLQVIDYKRYDVDLILLKKTGLFMRLIPKEVNLLDLNKDYQIFQDNLIKSVIQFIRNRNFTLALNRCVFTIKNRLIKNKNKGEQKSWRNKAKSIIPLSTEYDIAIGYMEKTSIYFVVDKVKAKKKMGWIHTNYKNSNMDKSIDNIYFKQLNNIITISEECSNSLKKIFPKYKNKIDIIYNIISPKLIKELSLDSKEVKTIYKDDIINILTVARLSYEKGVDNAIKACKELLERGININWYIIGDGPERKNIQIEIMRNKLEEKFVLLGIKTNPYPYIQECDIYVQPSRYEGKSISIDEAKILHKPIIVTNFDTVKEQIENNTNGLICEMNYIDIANKVESIIKNSDLKNNIINSLKKEDLGTEYEIEKLYNLWE